MKKATHEKTCILQDRDEKRRLRVGFVSADFYRHVVAYFILPALTHRDRADLHVTLYSCGRKVGKGVCESERLCEGGRKGGSAGGRGGDSLYVRVRACVVNMRVLVCVRFCVYMCMCV